MKSIILVLLGLVSVSLFSMKVEDIVIKMDENQTFSSYRGEGKVIIEGKYGKRISEYTAYSKGVDNTLIQFISGEEEGQKIFKTPDDLYIWYPFAEEIQRLSRKKSLGAVSYDEMSGEKNTLKDYKAELLGEDVVLNRDVYRVMLTAKTSKVPHYKKEIFIDKENFAVLKILYYSKSGKLTKEMKAIKVEEHGTYSVVVHSLITDKLKKNNSTENILSSISIDLEIDDDLFSLGELSW